MTADLLQYRTTHFVLWRPGHSTPPPVLVIGEFQPGAPPTLAGEQRLPLRPSPKGADVWEIPAADCNLVEGRVYHYWFEVTDTNPYRSTHPRVWCTDPLAATVNCQLQPPSLPAPLTDDDRAPAAVIKFQQGRLVHCDPHGETPDWTGDAGLETLPPNNRLVIYELPTRWAKMGPEGAETGVGTFRDVIALIERNAEPANFVGIAALEPGRAHLLDLGVNALELLPPADSLVDREWGYSTSNYFAADFDLGHPDSHSWPTATSDLVRLVKVCHAHGLRFFDDMVMAFGARDPYQDINFPDFHVQQGANDPEEVGDAGPRNNYSYQLFKYKTQTHGYDPLSGVTGPLVPARAFMRTHLVRWMLDFRVDGIRMDSIPNIGNWQFVGEFKDDAHRLWNTRWQEAGLGPEGRDERFLVVGEDLDMRMDHLTQGRLDALWNETFKRMVRYAIMGQNDVSEPSFEWTVRKLIDCRNLGFGYGAQAINYVTSHDVEGLRNERLFNLLNNNQITDTEPRIKLAFVCLLTAVGIPMILAGEEFADQHDLATSYPQKEFDTVNYDRMDEPWRKRVFDYVARLVKFRTSSGALAVNDTDFIHVDFNEGKRVLVWQRGQPGSDNVVVVVANFSDYGTPQRGAPNAEYVVPKWPATPPGKQWWEITQARRVPAEWVGREPVYPWEAKVYTLV